VVGTSGEWDRYLRWNDAIADVVYSTSNAGQPVYLDLEDHVLDAIRNKVDPAARSATVGLVRAVRDALQVDGGPAAMLRPLLDRLERWERGDPEDPPPTLALLAVMSLAAENMREGNGKAANNFYGRLAELLSFDDDQREDFISAYRKLRAGRATSDVLWGSLSLWQELLEGNRGLVTVFADRNVHVSLPMSQALVREVDRDKFRAMFALYGLAPHSALPMAEMAEVIDDWMSRDPCPASHQLERLWKRDPDARERIADVAKLTLESWDGSGLTVAHGPKGARLNLDHIRIRGRMRSFPRKGVELSLLVPAIDGLVAESATVIGLAGEDLGEVDLIPAASGWIGLADVGALDPSSFLAGETKLRLAGSGSLVRRRPRRVVPLRFDDLLQGYLECERVNLGDDFMLLVHRDVASRVDLALSAAARPGHQRYDEFDGLSEGWVLYDRVQILSPISPELVQHMDLSPLQPIASSQAALQGGLILPGNIKKWSSFRPPELRVSVGDESCLSATVSSIRALTSPAPAPVTRETEQPVLIWDLASQYLPDGDYEIVIAVEGAPMGRPIRLRLRSADHPALVVDEGAACIGHDPDSPAFGLLASPRSSARCFEVAPAYVEEVISEAAPTFTPLWIEARQLSSTDRAVVRHGAAIQVPSPQSGSCMLTGAHVMVIPTVYPGHPKQKLIDGVCRYCGLTKRYPTHGRKKRSTRAPKRTRPIFDPASLDPVRPREGVDWRIGLDALSHLGTGPTSSLERVAAQIDPTGLFIDTFARRLEVLGHIEIRRSPVTLQPVSWAINPPSVIGVGGGRFVFVGFRSESMIAAAEDAAHRNGLDLDEERVDGAPVLSVTIDDRDVLDEILYELGAATGREPQVIPDAALALAASLPPLSKVLVALPTVNATGGRGIERWDPMTARFSTVADVHAPGAYRLKTFGSVYLYRRPDDISAMTATLGDARIVKYAAALDSGFPLLGYDETARVLYVPLGADLPGLYGRAAVLASGRPPTEDPKQRILRYQDVPPTLAARLQTLLMS
jgi:hypothetical protein